jgi:glutamate synthase (NADPH/NADH) small chain
VNAPGFTNQLGLLERRLTADPRAFRNLFTADGMQAVAWEFRQAELGHDFIWQLWDVLSRDDDASRVMMRFLWKLPLGKKRLFVRALDAHMSEKYPMFRGLSQNWPAGNAIEPYIRDADVRSQDFELVNKGFLGYMDLGFTRRDIELFVWLEALRDKQCAEAPCELGVLIAGHVEPQGGCPVQIHIPTMFELIGEGRFREALEMLESCNPLPNVTGRVCPQELQCQGMCLHKKSMSIGQLEWFLPEWEKLADPVGLAARFRGLDDPWLKAVRPPVAIVGSGPSGLITAYLLAAEGFPVTVFEAFHELGGVLRYGIPEFRLPNQLIDDVVAKIRGLGGRFVTNFVVGKTATLEQLRDAGFLRVFVGSGAGLPRFLNVPGEHLLNVMSANEFLTRVNLMQGHRTNHETPLPEVRGKEVLVIGGGNTAMDAARTARRLGGNVSIVYRRTRAEMPARVEELEHALEEGIELEVLRSPIEFAGDPQTHFVTGATVEIIALGEPDSSGRRRPVPTGRTDEIPADLVIMALGNSANPIIKDSEPKLSVSKWGTIEQTGEQGSKETSIPGIYTGGDAARGGSTAIRAAGDGQAAAREIVRTMAGMDAADISDRVSRALTYTEVASEFPVIVRKTRLSAGIEELEVRAPVIARSAKAGQFVRVLASSDGELVPLTLADWNAEAGTITLVIQAMGTSTLKMNEMQVGEAFAGIAGPLGRASELARYEDAEVVFTAGGLGLPPVYPIMREHLRMGNRVTLISGFRSLDLMFWNASDERIGQMEAEYGDQLTVIYATNDGSFGVQGFVTAPLKEMLDAHRDGTGKQIAEVITIGPPMMMRGVSDLTKPYGVHCVASLNSIMVDATGMCGACMVPVIEGDQLIRKHACIDGPEIDAHAIDWEKFLPRFGLFRSQEQASRAAHGF